MSGDAGLWGACCHEAVYRPVGRGTLLEMLASMLPLFVACQETPPGGEPRRYTDSLTAVAADPSRTGAACGALVTPALREDCVLAGVERLVSADPAAATALCEGLAEGLSRDECGFVLAEKTGEAARCEAAGRFALDCRMHLLQRGVSRADLPPDPVALEEPALALLGAGGFVHDDEHAWTLLYRDALSRQPALDLTRCDATPRPPICRRAGGGLFHDRLNFARDTQALTDEWCTTRTGIAVLNHTPDPDIDAILSQRADICP
ncbi:MAG: hypothetical protein ACI8RZ_004142 [Myxococcota bacterium]|jgi:hypothetical protein